MSYYYYFALLEVLYYTYFLSFPSRITVLNKADPKISRLKFGCRITLIIFLFYLLWVDINTLMNHNTRMKNLYKSILNKLKNGKPLFLIHALMKKIKSYTYVNCSHMEKSLTTTYINENYSSQRKKFESIVTTN